MSVHSIGLLSFWVLAIMASHAVSQDVSSFSIMKADESAHPIVSTDLVERMGASNVLTLLGEDFLVTTPNELSQMVPGKADAPQVIPGTGIPGIPPGILPTCQCPEGYVISLIERLQTPETLFGPAPSAAPTADRLNNPTFNQHMQVPQFDFGTQFNVTPGR